MKYLFIDASENSTFAQTGDTDGFKPRSFATDRNFAARITLICDEMLGNAGWSFSDLDCLALCTGPGSLTGLRVAAAFLRTAAMLTGKPLVGVNLFEWSLQSLLNQKKTGAIRVVMPTLIDKAFMVEATLPSLHHSNPELIDRSASGTHPDTYGIRFTVPGVTEVKLDPAALHEILCKKELKAAAGMSEILNILPMYVIPSQAERKFKENL